MISRKDFVVRNGMKRTQRSDDKTGGRNVDLFVLPNIRYSHIEIFIYILNCTELSPSVRVPWFVFTETGIHLRQQIS